MRSIEHIAKDWRSRLSHLDSGEELNVQAGELGRVISALEDQTLRADTETRRVLLLNQLIDATHSKPFPRLCTTAPACH